MKLNMGRILAWRTGGSIRIVTKIYLLVSFCLGLGALVSALSLVQMNNISVEIEKIAERYIPLTRDLTEITIHQLEQAVNFERAFRAGEVMNEHAGARGEFEKAVRIFAELTGKIEQEFGEVKDITRHALAASVSEEERQKYQSVLTMLGKLDLEHGDYDRLAWKAFQKIAAGQLDQALAMLPRIEAEEKDLDLQLGKMLHELEKVTVSAALMLKAHEQFAIKLLLALTGIALTFGTAASTYLVRHSISRPLNEITKGLAALSADDMSVEVKVYSDDEIGPVAKAYTDYKKTIIKLRNSQLELTAHRDHLQDTVDEATADLKIKALELKESLSKEQKLNALQRQFVSMASHEFRTPLTIIDMAAQFLVGKGENITPDYLRVKTGEIRNAVKNMTRLMESTLAAARMQDGKIKITLLPCDISMVLRDVCARQQGIAQTHVITCNLMELPETIQADTGSVEQILTNLLSNAVKYAPDAPDIEVIAHTQADQVVISVRDHGIGIDTDDLPRIGERFFRAKTSTGIAGTGIGLNLVKKLIEMHGGTVNAESKKGEGSTFTIHLPIAGPERSKQADAKVA